MNEHMKVDPFRAFRLGMPLLFASIVSVGVLFVPAALAAAFRLSDPLPLLVGATVWFIVYGRTFVMLAVLLRDIAALLSGNEPPTVVEFRKQSARELAGKANPMPARMPFSVLVALGNPLIPGIFFAWLYLATKRIHDQRSAAMEQRKPSSPEMRTASVISSLARVAA